MDSHLTCFTPPNNNFTVISAVWESQRLFNNGSTPGTLLSATVCKEEIGVQKDIQHHVPRNLWKNQGRIANPRLLVLSVYQKILQTKQKLFLGSCFGFCLTVLNCYSKTSSVPPAGIRLQRCTFSWAQEEPTVWYGCPWSAHAGNRISGNTWHKVGWFPKIPLELVVSWRKQHRVSDFCAVYPDTHDTIRRHRLGLQTGLR